MIRRDYSLILLGLFAFASAWAVAQDAEDLAQQRRQLEALRKHPEQLARLREHLQAFNAQSDLRKAAIVELDRKIHEFPAKKQDRYWNVMARYADWLEQLRKKDPQAYQAIKEAPDAATRLARIRERRDAEWIQTQPEKTRELWSRSQGDERTKLVEKLRAEERQRQQQWTLASRFWKELESKQTLPCRLSDFQGSKVREYVENYLMPFLSEQEKKRLQEAEDQWPDYPQTLVAIASKHPSALPPPREEDLPRKFSQLPIPIQQRVTDKKAATGKIKLLPKLDPFKDSPSFASKVVEFGTRGGNLPFDHEFWACNYKSLLPPMKEFVKEKLIPAMKDNLADQQALRDSDGRWPYYALTIQELSKKYKLQPPWHILPEAERWRWDEYRLERVNSWGSEVAKDKKGP